MKLTIYNEEFEFSEKLSEKFINTYVPDNFQPFNCPIKEIEPNHPFAVGWLESLAQSKISNLFYWTNFTHIKFEKT